MRRTLLKGGNTISGIFKHIENTGWSKKQLFNLYKKENPNWDDDKCLEKAKLIYKELNRLNANMYNNNKTFFEHNIPLSYSPLLEEGYFGEFRKTDQYKFDCQSVHNIKIIKKIVKQLDNKEERDNDE